MHDATSGVKQWHDNKHTQDAPRRGQRSGAAHLESRHTRDNEVSHQPHGPNNACLLSGHHANKPATSALSRTVPGIPGPTKCAHGRLSPAHPRRTLAPKSSCRQGKIDESILSRRSQSRGHNRDLSVAQRAQEHARGNGGIATSVTRTTGTSIRNTQSEQLVIPTQRATQSQADRPSTTSPTPPHTACPSPIIPRDSLSPSLTL